MDTIKFAALPDQSNSMRESLRVLRNNIQFCGDDVKVILVTSTVPDEGKSTVAFNLARSFSESDKRVLLVDTDMRKSVLANRLHATNEKQNGILYGLAHYLSGQKKITESIYATDVFNLFVMFAGSNVPNATELLEREHFEKMINAARSQFDFIIIDCAPLGATIDAAVVAKHCDGAILVISQGVLKTRMVKKSIQQLELTGVRILGAVLNKVKKKKNEYGYGYGYGYYYTYSDQKAQ